MVSGAAVPNTRLDASTTPTDFLLPSAMVNAWLTHLPSKYTLAAVETVAALRWVVLMG